MPRARQPKLTDVVVVEWDDAWSTNEGNATIEDAAKHVPIRMREVGFLIADTDEGLTLASSTSHEIANYRYINFIPRGMVRSVKVLK